MTRWFQSSSCAPPKARNSPVPPSGRNASVATFSPAAGFVLLRQLPGWVFCVVTLAPLFGSPDVPRGSAGDLRECENVRARTASDVLARASSFAMIESFPTLHEQEPLAPHRLIG